MIFMFLCIRQGIHVANLPYRIVPNKLTKPPAQIEVIALTQEETVFCETLSSSLGAGERESIAIARERKGTLLANESRVAHYCRQYQIPCLRLSAILRALWTEGLMS